jgi:hypothetical protein
MSSGACRALVAVLLTLVATIVMALPVVAKTDSLVELSTVTYTVHPGSSEIDVSQVFVLKTRQSAFPSQDWGPIVVEERARPSVGSGFSLVEGASDLPGLWKAVQVQTPRVEGGGSRAKFVVSYTIDASITQSGARRSSTPARVDGSYIYFCVPGQDTDSGSVSIKIDNNSKFKVTQTGTVLDPVNGGLKSETSRAPGLIFTCIEGTRDGRLATDTFVGPAERQVLLQAWEDEPGWLQSAKSRSRPALDDIHRFLGHDIPGDGAVVIRQAPARELGGYASAHNTPGIVQLDEGGGTVAPEHELAHAWFGTDNFSHLWLREAMAEWTATAMSGAACAPVTSNAADLDLSEWQVVQPTSGADIDQIILDQEAASCGIVSAVASRMSDEQWREVLGSMLNGETKYIGSAGPDAASTTIVDYREWLDAVDERGLIPAGSDAAFAENLTDLDFAQDLLDDFGVPASAPELAARSEARAYYHRFLADAAPLGAPLAVRKAMDDWRFEDATAALDQSYEVLTALQEADALLPTAGLIPLIQNPFENASTVDAIESVRVEALDLLDRASELVTPLSELQQTSPADWGFPAAIRDAINDRRFEDAKAAIAPAIAVVGEVTAADAALPMAGLLDKYRVRYEATTTANKLSELAEDTADERRVAEATGIALGLLKTEVGDWAIPSAVMDPINEGRIVIGRAIVDDARGVVSAARGADTALPEAQLSAEIRPRFEAVLTGAEMTALREEAETRRDDAVAVGDALDLLSARVPTWQIPEVVTRPVEERDFATAAVAATAAQKWVENAWQADQDLPQIGALDRIKADFESAQELIVLEAGAALAEDWAQAADHVRRADEAVKADRDLLTNFGLWGTDVDTPAAEAMAAAIDGRVDEAIQKSAEVISLINSGASGGGLRLAGLVFFGVAVLGVLGLWLMLRRDAGPSWARQTTPHWKKKDSRWRGGKKDE